MPVTLISDRKKFIGKCLYFVGTNFTNIGEGNFTYLTMEMQYYLEAIVLY